MTKKDWLDFRFNGIGGSETGNILGLNDYPNGSSHEVFYKKLGEGDYEQENLHMFAGKRHENMIADDYWRYYDPMHPDFQNTMQNFNEKRIIRKCRRVNAYVVNPDYPWLFASIDRLINKGQSAITIGNPDKEGILEIKTISSYAAKKWIVGIPRMHVAQLQTYLLVLNLDYGELATLKDGKYFEVIPFQRDEELIKVIIEVTKDFWDRVTSARILKQSGKPYEALEPEIDNIEAYKEFLSERYKAEPNKLAPNMQIYNLGTEYLNLNDEIKLLEEKQTGIANKIKEHFKESDEMDFGASGKITWKQNKSSMVLDKDKFKETQPNLYDSYLIEKPGSRVLRIGLKIKNENQKAA
jgi:predicted phage-related endonuclease